MHIYIIYGTMHIIYGTMHICQYLLADTLTIRGLLHSNSSTSVNYKYISFLSSEL